jgi:uncharacterized protein (DUF2235 family)
MDFWEPGDRVLLFGFSRGAYTARVVAGLLYTLGLLPRGQHNLVPYVTRLFGAVRREEPPEVTGEPKGYWALCQEFRRTFARPVPGDEEGRRFRVHFLGLWDTVSSVGWVWDPAKYPYTRRNPGVAVVRHAVALDERRWFFRQNQVQAAEGQDCRELWFPGVHADVGGGYPEAEGGLWRAPFEWILADAEAAGLRVNAGRKAAVLTRTPPSEKPWADPQHESLTAKWWPAEFFPKLTWVPKAGARRPRVGRGRRRYVPDGSLMDRTVLLRIRETDYAPANLSDAFVRRVRGLPSDGVPEALAYVRESAGITTAPDPEPPGPLPAP